MRYTLYTEKIACCGKKATLQSTKLPGQNPIQWPKIVFSKSVLDSALVNS